ncbi:hypothetical protein SARC_16650 [Sphaeroforma arctica JP610]|uniref:SAP domain-containing protein n=1 Tax=Sphaeroforma arctica JP610 TaxID=667725 RepID=A0A0L0F2A9_9EUKA|nr:hypothetical protein SARC_16650 [Sphaeroforma arctica JP610]KNC70822.1 hypothetical protein SARC_16650 [Sphaeroforma arctica JP610]|eukprot:XP_014144724.1 hypothetical protein SARC_16650 [Sphaeroforma arctica JP610]
MRPRQSLERITNKDGSVIIEDTAEVSITAVAAGKGALKGTEQTPATSRRKRKAVEEVTPTAIALGAASLQPLRVADLRVLCAARGLSVAGRKRQLIHRLLAHAQSASGPVISVYDSGASCNALDMGRYLQALPRVSVVLGPWCSVLRPVGSA